MANPCCTTVEHWRDENITLTVEQPRDGFWNSISLWARVPLPPNEVYEILTDPHNHKYFRSIKARTSLKQTTFPFILTSLYSLQTIMSLYAGNEEQAGHKRQRQ